MESECVLPPQVCGHPTGELVVKVDEIFWLKCSPGDIFVHLQWWGEKSYNVFWPVDLNQKKESNDERPNSVTYTLRTNPDLFETYIRNCRELIFYVVKEADRTIVGTASVKDLVDILIVKTYSSYSSYYPIYNLQKARIGDLRVNFSLFLKKNSDTLDCFPKKCPLVIPSSTKEKNTALLRKKNKTIADVVSRGQELRKEMVKSILKDCPIDKVERVIRSQNASGDKLSPPKENASLIDYVVGKKLKGPECEEAEKTLRCFSSDSFKEPSLIKFSTMDNDSNDYEVKYVRNGSWSVLAIEGVVGIVNSDTVLFERSVHANARKDSHNELYLICELTEEVDDGVFDGTSENQNGPLVEILKEENRSQKIAENHHKPSIKKENRVHHHVEGKWIGKYKMLQTMDCFRFTIREIILNSSASKKINNTPALKPTIRQIRAASAPGTIFSVEFRLPVKTISRLAHKPTVFISKKYHGNDVIFGDNVVMKLPSGDDFPWLKVSRLCGGGEVRAYWRHLNQRLPTLLGSAFIPDIKTGSCELEDLASTLNLTIPIVSSAKVAVGKLVVCLELGRNNKAFGESLFNALTIICGNKMKNKRKALHNSSIVHNEPDERQ